MTIKKSIGGVLLALGVLSGSAHAALVDRGSYFIDTLTGLDWLNNTPLAGQSYNAVMNGYGGYIAAGWRFASANDLIRLVNSYVFTSSSFSGLGAMTVFDSATIVKANALIPLLGINVSSGAPPDPRATSQNYTTSGTSIGTQAWYGDFDASGRVSLFNLITGDQPAFLPDPYSFVQIYPGSYSPDDVHGMNVSSVLVRGVANYTSVPEPSTISLLGLALAGLAFRHRNYYRTH